MATNTTRASLRKPGTSDFVTVGTDINDNMDQIDQHLGHLECTSATRPTGTDRFTGRTIWETDTGLTYLWDGAAWQNIGGRYDANSWTLAITGSTSGTATVAGTVSNRYVRQGKWVDLWINYTLNASSSFAAAIGSLRFSFPPLLQPISATATPYVSSGSVINGTNRKIVSVQQDGAPGSAFMILVFQDAASAVVTNGAPWTWGSGDIIRFAARYEVNV